MHFITTADIAAALGVSREYATDRVVKRPDFPAPKIRLSRKVVRWARDEFEAWRDAQAIRAAAQSARRKAGSTP